MINLIEQTEAKFVFEGEGNDLHTTIKSFPFTHTIKRTNKEEITDYNIKLKLHVSIKPNKIYPRYIEGFPRFNIYADGVNLIQHYNSVIFDKWSIIQFTNNNRVVYKWNTPSNFNKFSPTNISGGAVILYTPFDAIWDLDLHFIPSRYYPRDIKPEWNNFSVYQIEILDAYYDKLNEKTDWLEFKVDITSNLISPGTYPHEFGFNLLQGWQNSLFDLPQWRTVYETEYPDKYQDAAFYNFRVVESDGMQDSVIKLPFVAQDPVSVIKFAHRCNELAEGSPRQQIVTLVHEHKNGDGESDYWYFPMRFKNVKLNEVAKNSIEDIWVTGTFEFERVNKAEYFPSDNKVAKLPFLKEDSIWDANRTPTGLMQMRTWNNNYLEYVTNFDNKTDGTDSYGSYYNNQVGYECGQGFYEELQKILTEYERGMLLQDGVWPKGYKARDLKLPLIFRGKTEAELWFNYWHTFNDWHFMTKVQWIYSLFRYNKANRVSPSYFNGYFKGFKCSRFVKKSDGSCFMEGVMTWRCCGLDYRVSGNILNV